MLYQSKSWSSRQSSQFNSLFYLSPMDTSFYWLKEKDCEFKCPNWLSLGSTLEPEGLRVELLFCCFLSRSHLRWLGHLIRMPMDVLIQDCLYCHCTIIIYNKIKCSSCNVLKTHASRTTISPYTHTQKYIYVWCFWHIHLGGDPRKDPACTAETFWCPLGAAGEF